MGKWFGTLVNNKGTDQTVLMHSLIRASVLHYKVFKLYLLHLKFQVSS